MSVTKTPNGRWRARLKSGRQAVASKTFDRKTDAVRWIESQRRALEVGDFIDPKAGREKLADAWARWQLTRVNTKSATTHSTDRAAFRALPVSLRNRPLSAVTASHFETLYGDLLGRLARSSVLRYRNTYGSFFSWAVRERLVRSNPALAGAVPRGASARSRTEIWPLSVAELREVHEALFEEAGKASADIALVLGLTGLRTGELSALRVRDVQRVPAPALLVRRSKSEGAPLRNSTKGGKDRVVPLVQESWEIIEPLTRGQDPEALLFPTSTGGYRSFATWKRDVKWSKHGRGRRVQDLRHSFATNALAAGTDLKTLQAWLGHASAKLTADTYSHWLGSDADNAAVARLNEAWNRSNRGDAGGTRRRA